MVGLWAIGTMVSAATARRDCCGGAMATNRLAGSRVISRFDTDLNFFTYLMLFSKIICSVKEITTRFAKNAGSFAAARPPKML